VADTNTTHDPGTAGRGADPVKAVRAPRPGAWVGAAAVAVLLAMLVHTLLTNQRYQWDVVFTWFTSDRILTGLGRTLVLTLISMVIGVVLGAVLAVMRLSSNPLISGVAWSYIWLLRGTPVFVQLLFWGFIAALYPRLSLGIPFGPEFVQFSANDLITPYVAAILGLGLNEAAYMAEIVRAGISSVDDGQAEAAQALGMNRWLALRRVVIPQAMRLIIPPTGNQVIGMLKTTSLVAVLAFPELLYSAQLIYAVNYQTIPLLITASLWYLIVTSVLSIGQYYLERYFGRGTSRSSTSKPRRRWRTPSGPVHDRPGEKP
jgi:polar amino acid transport system permease protein